MLYNVDSFEGSVPRIRGKGGINLKIGVISDTHGYTEAVQQAMRLLPDADAWIHLGDYATDMDEVVEQGITVYRVNGNCSPLLSIPNEQCVELGGVKLFLAHGHRYAVDYDRSMLAYKAESMDCRVALYGHTHVPEIAFSGSVMLLNPGSPAFPRQGAKRTFALLKIENGEVDAEMIALD